MLYQLSYSREVTSSALCTRRRQRRSGRRATCRTRTDDPVITSDVLYQLS
jgi:hypothetical protein